MSVGCLHGPKWLRCAKSPASEKFSLVTSRWAPDPVLNGVK